MERKGNDDRKRCKWEQGKTMLIGGEEERELSKKEASHKKKKDSKFTWMKNKKGRKFWRWRRKEQIVIYRTGKRKWNSIRRENRMNKNNGKEKWNMKQKEDRNTKAEVHFSFRIMFIFVSNKNCYFDLQLQ